MTDWAAGAPSYTIEGKSGHSRGPEPYLPGCAVRDTTKCANVAVENCCHNEMVQGQCMRDGDCGVDEVCPRNSGT